MNKIIFFFLLCISLFIALNPSNGQEKSTNLPKKDNIEIVSGIVQSITSDRIMIVEVVMDKKNPAFLTFIFDPEIQFVNVDSWNGITKNDNVQVAYKTSNNQKIAISIIVDKNNYNSNHYDDFSSNTDYSNNSDYNSQTSSYNETDYNNYINNNENGNLNNPINNDQPDIQPEVEIPNVTDESNSSENN